jgi:hypothetical protein
LVSAGTGGSFSASRADNAAGHGDEGELPAGLVAELEAGVPGEPDENEGRFVRQSLWQKLQKEYEEAAAPRELVSLRPAFMLSALLIEAEIACRKVGCEFEVWCDVR